MADVSGNKAFCRIPALGFKYKIRRVLNKIKKKKGEKLGSRNVLKHEYRVVIKTLLLDLSGRLHKD